MNLKISYSGVRGIVGDGLDEEVARRFGVAFGELVARRYSHPTILLARDNRASGPALLEAVAQGVAKYAARLLDLGVVATPTVQFAMEPLEAQAAIVVTASHNPSEWNGFKFMLGPDNTVLDGRQTEELFELYQDTETATGVEASAEDLHSKALELHVQRVLEQVDVPLIRARGLKVALDAGGGAGEKGALALLDSLGCEVVRVTAHRESEPTVESLQELARVVASESADIGMAQDMDGDRLALVDETGRPTGEEATLLLVVDHLLTKYETASVVRNLSTTHAIDKIVEARGGQIVETKVGEVNLSRALAKLRAEGAITFGGEGSGGVIYPAVCLGRDSLIGMALVLESLAKSGRTVSQLIDALPHLFMLKDKLELRDPQQLESLYQHVAANFPEAEASRKDGLKLLTANGSWVLLRPSNTEPVVRVAVESEDEAWCREAMKRVYRLWTGR